MKMMKTINLMMLKKVCIQAMLKCFSGIYIIKGNTCTGVAKGGGHKGATPSPVDRKKANKKGKGV